MIRAHLFTKADSSDPDNLTTVLSFTEGPDNGYPTKGYKYVLNEPPSEKAINKIIAMALDDMLYHDGKTGRVKNFPN